MKWFLSLPTYCYLINIILCLWNIHISLYLYWRIWTFYIKDQNLFLFSSKSCLISWTSFHLHIKTYFPLFLIFSDLKIDFKNLCYLFHISYQHTFLDIYYCGKHQKIHFLWPKNTSEVAITRKSRSKNVFIKYSRPVIKRTQLTQKSYTTHTNTQRGWIQIRYWIIRKSNQVIKKEKKEKFPSI